MLINAYTKITSASSQDDQCVYVHTHKSPYKHGQITSSHCGDTHTFPAGRLPAETIHRKHQFVVSERGFLLTGLFHLGRDKLAAFERVIEFGCFGDGGRGVRVGKAIRNRHWFTDSELVRASLVEGR